ncbi:MAG: bifunctional glutamate N-acetyltransferase/amino-acid acetyltransferase ArgJ [Proteobacteria bacterium]|nr:bifunctional glutamate N-acetyltransferase/amino-acid acetyltransferase ArgJ [Pseudomonadota bacterium]MBU2226356.1 bifunctional glutamate N-acetyltransferase/amino-acid acetyltransferase ArgJ [Pseudomonadota bacterium]MBU2260900.1 bifunctional glutamate N-acetyltransferase/amino-acid acetyltransferase ArgJ [Pseudomonadota bacterium]
MEPNNYRVPGFLANGVHAGIKTDGRPDLSLLYSTRPAAAAGVFTTNCFKAAPVLIDMERIRTGEAQAVIANSGVANAATGAEGLADARAVSRAASGELGIPDELVLVASTGVIGHRLPLGKIVEGVKGLVAGLHEDGIPAAEAGIMTTDRFPKIVSRKGLIGSKEVTLCGIAKGAGMIEPHMATMLAFVMTDADIEPEVLNVVFRQAAGGSFNAVTVDGCMSTNDTAIILANGLAGNPRLKRGSHDLGRFGGMLSSLMVELARELVRDGEGATKVIEIAVEEAKTLRDAQRVAYAIANSNLVKTAFFGGDPNWGRIIAAAGAAGVPLPAEKVRLFLEDVPVFSGGRGVAGREQELAEIMKRTQIRVRLELGMGRRSWTVFASDLSFDYVKINAHYHT